MKAPSGAEVELERCTSCGGFWGERGRIQDAFGPPAQYELVGGMTHRRCVLCRILMTPAQLPAGIAVEVCSACRGMFLDKDELAQIGVRSQGGTSRRSGPAQPMAVQRPAPRAAPPPVPVARAPEAPKEPEVIALSAEEEVPPEDTSGTFACVVCGKRKPLRQGQALRDGLACRACMKARAEGDEGGEELGLRGLLFGRPKKP
ncbi:zf-TFIIB domain-containing protein [Hyalangium rubrum]|uniref:Zf-TFIIB domain-containing protein n=1 Tax=Hyalangium rubrum TaxID=3103134 RepID=A0ABU5H6S5_9BACT|nr:zf-TFIIB domain-containing protein [Hyalangium sp. s54d21]MDY7229176.1 zf-TFIIB domain-containing protein [Hyalangium sp. s54d21]